MNQSRSLIFLFSFLMAFAIIGCDSGGDGGSSGPVEITSTLPADLSNISYNDTVTLYGTNFGKTRGTVGLGNLFYSSTGVFADSEIQSWSNTQITFTMPVTENYEPYGGGIYVITNKGVSSNQSATSLSFPISIHFEPEGTTESPIVLSLDNDYYGSCFGATYSYYTITTTPDKKYLITISDMLGIGYNNSSMVRIGKCGDNFIGTYAVNAEPENPETYLDSMEFTANSSITYLTIMGNNATYTISVTESGPSTEDLTAITTAFSNGIASATIDNGSDTSDPANTVMKLRNDESSVKIEYTFSSVQDASHGDAYRPDSGSGQYIFTNYTDANGAVINGTLDFDLSYSDFVWEDLGGGVWMTTKYKTTYTVTGDLVFTGNLDYTVSYDYSMLMDMTVEPSTYTYSGSVTIDDTEHTFNADGSLND